jgi:hypothetical protein
MFEHGGKTTLRLAGHEISMEEFRGLVIYTMCNTDLEENDPRLELLEDIQSLTVIEDRHGKRLDGLRPLPHHFAFR